MLRLLTTSFDVRPISAMALVGEPGCGKSITTKVIMGLTDPKETITGEVLYKDQDLLKLQRRKLASCLVTSLLWFTRTSVFTEPFYAYFVSDEAAY